MALSFGSNERVPAARIDTSESTPHQPAFKVILDLSKGLADYAGAELTLADREQLAIGITREIADTFGDHLDRSKLIAAIALELGVEVKPVAEDEPTTGNGSEATVMTAPHAIRAEEP